MINRLLSLILCLILFMIFPSFSSAKSVITITETWGTFTDLPDATQQFQEYPDMFFDINNDIIPTALAIVNTIGYPNGRSIIKPFPHLEFGAAVGGGVLEYNRKREYTNDNPTIYFMGVNGGFHIGTGITNSIDATLKVFIFSLGSLTDSTRGLEADGGDTSYRIEIKDADLNSYGVKFRYNFVERRVIYPLVFSFGGMTLNLAFDYMRGKIKSSFNIENIQTVDFTYGGTPYNTQVILNVSGDPEIDFNLYSVTPEAFIYFDIFSLFSFYTGPSASLNFGELNFDLQASGDLMYLTNELATVELESKYTMKPRLFIPRWTAGLEISILALKFQLEGSTILTNASDSFTGQAGVRFQF